MKRFIYSIMIAVLPVLAISFASCSDDKDLPDVNISLNVENAEIVNGTIYVVQGDTLNVTGVNVKNNEAGKNAAVTNVRYYIDGIYLGESIFAPFPANGITDENTPVGTYDLGMTCTVLAVDKSIAFGALNYPIKVVASASDIPTNAPALTTDTQTVKLSNN